MQSSFVKPVTFVIEETWDESDLLAMWQDLIFASFLIQIFRSCVKKEKWLDQTFTKPKGKFFLPSK